MLLPTVRNSEDLNIRSSFSAHLNGPPTNADEALVAGKLKQIEKDERALADLYIARDNSADDLDPRPGFVALASRCVKRDNQANGLDREITDAVQVRFDPQTMRPLEMTTRTETVATYFRGYVRHVIATSHVTWNAEGHIVSLEERRDATGAFAQPGALKIVPEGSGIFYQEVRGN